jgi:hypothetical protein
MNRHGSHSHVNGTSARNRVLIGSVDGERAQRTATPLLHASRRSVVPHCSQCRAEHLRGHSRSNSIAPGERDDLTQGPAAILLQSSCVGVTPHGVDHGLNDDAASLTDAMVVQRLSCKVSQRAAALLLNVSNAIVALHRSDSGTDTARTTNQRRESNVGSEISQRRAAVQLHGSVIRMSLHRSHHRCDATSTGDRQLVCIVVEHKPRDRTTAMRMHASCKCAIAQLHRRHHSVDTIGGGDRDLVRGIVAGQVCKRTAGLLLKRSGDTAMVTHGRKHSLNAPGCSHSDLVCSAADS